MQRKERARIASALIGYALRHRLGALKMLARVEVGALPAGMEFCPALGTVAERIGQGWEWCSAVHAAGDGPGLRHRGRARSGRLLGLSRPLLLVFPVAPLAVSSVFHGRPPGFRLLAAQRPHSPVLLKAPLEEVVVPEVEQRAEVGLDGLPHGAAYGGRVPVGR